ncbi:MAG: hypothetical protein ACKOI3_02335 [Actinomycetota bacterium]
MRNDRGSATPLFVAVIVLVSLVDVAVSSMAQSIIDAGRATAAAEALAVAAVLDEDLALLAAEHEVDDYAVSYDDGVVTVQVSRHGVSARASAIDHRRTLDSTE